MDELNLNNRSALAGLGLRRGLMSAFKQLSPDDIDFIEVAPENWIGIGGRYGRSFREIAERYPVYLHGLSLNIGGFSPLDTSLLKDIKQFMADFDCPLYSEHLTYCGDEGQLYDLLPIPFTEEAVHHVADRVKQVQDVLGRRILLENASYYAAPAQEMSESEFINAVLTEADCELLLDVNTHGSDVIDPVWDLLDAAYERCGPLPTLLERDFNFPPMAELVLEVERIKRAQAINECSVASHRVAVR